MSLLVHFIIYPLILVSPFFQSSSSFSCVYVVVNICLRGLFWLVLFIFGGGCFRLNVFIDLCSDLLFILEYLDGMECES